MRHEIYDFILNNQGMHLSEICRNLDMAKTTLRYHLKCLEKQDLISAQYKGYKRYYIPKRIGTKEKKLLNLIREEIPRGIFLMLLFQTACSQVELSEALKKHPSTISFHLNKLIEADIIECAPVHNGVTLRLIAPRVLLRKPIGREKIYRFKSREIISTVYNLLVNHQKSIKNNHVFRDLLDEIDHYFSDYTESPHKIKQDPKKWSDSISEVFFEVFPHPYYV